MGRFSLPRHNGQEIRIWSQDTAGSARPCPGSGTLFPVPYGEGVKGRILELGGLGSSLRSHRSPSQSL